MLRVRERQANGARADEWNAAHEAFHAVLLAGCGNRRLVQISEGLRAETELYRRWASPSIEENGRDPAAEHQAITDAVVARDEARGAQLIREHIEFTTQMLLRSLAEARSPDLRTGIGIG